jgi:hypothetical protein
MNTNKLYAWIMIVGVAVLASAAIIFLTASVYSGNKNYQENAEVSVEPISEPEDVARAFYLWYLDYYGEPGSDNFHNPVSEKAYHDSPYLTPSFIGHVDEIVAGFQNRAAYDPFLCAQNIPLEVTPMGTFWHSGQASIVMSTNFPDHFITLDLQKVGEAWQISNITCPFSPEGTAKAFYTWYLAYTGDPATDEFRNPLVDKAYRDSGMLSAAFIEELDELTAGGIPADPILIAQGIPQDFSVDPGFEEGTAIVHLQFGTETVRHLKVSMVQELGHWKIDAISEAPLPTP